MRLFLDQHKERIVGVLSGFDRILFRGTLRCLDYQDGIDAFLATHRVLIKEFGKFAQELSEEVKEHAKEFAARHQRPLIYLPSAAVAKEDTALNICVEPYTADSLVHLFT